MHHTLNFCPDLPPRNPIYHGWTADVLRYVIKNWWTSCFEQLQRQIIYQNARILKKSWLIPWAPALSFWNLKKAMKMNWLHKFFLAVFLFQRTGKPNRPNSWFQRCCHSIPYIFHVMYLAEECKRSCCPNLNTLEVTLKAFVKVYCSFDLLWFLQAIFHEIN